MVAQRFGHRVFPGDCPGIVRVSMGIVRGLLAEIALDFQHARDVGGGSFRRSLFARKHERMVHRWPQACK